MLSKVHEPSVLFYLPNAELYGGPLKKVSEDGWNVVVAEKRDKFDQLAFELSFDVVVGDSKVHPSVLRKSAIVQAEKMDFLDVAGIVAALDHAYVLQAKPNITFIGPVQSYRDLQIGLDDVSDKVHMARRKDIRPHLLGNIVIYHEEKVPEGYNLASVIKELSIPSIVIAKDTSKEFVGLSKVLKEDDVNSSIKLKRVLRDAFSSFNVTRASGKKTVKLIQKGSDQSLAKKMVSEGHDLNVSGEDEVERLMDVFSEKVPEAVSVEKHLPMHVDAVVGPVTDKFIEVMKLLKAHRPGLKVYGYTPYNSTLERMDAFKFMLDGGDAFLPDGRASSLLSDELRKSKPALPLRETYSKVEKKAIAQNCIDGEREMLSGEMRGATEGIVHLWNAISSSKTGLPVQVLQYCLRIMDEGRKRAINERIHQKIEYVKEVSGLEEAIKGIGEIGESRFRDLVQNLRLVVGKEKFLDPESGVYYYAFSKFRKPDEALKYVNTFDFLTRINREILKLKPTRIERMKSIFKRPVDLLRRPVSGWREFFKEERIVKLSELTHYGAVSDDIMQLKEIENAVDSRDLFDYVMGAEDGILALLEKAVQQAARMSAYGPQSVALPVGNLSDFWGSRFSKRISEPIRGGMNRVFGQELNETIFESLEKGLAEVYAFADACVLPKSFYSDRWLGNFGVRKNGEVFNFGYRTAYMLPFIVEAVTLFQHTDFWPGSDFTEKIKIESEYVRKFCREYDSAVELFNKIALNKNEDLISEQIRMDLEERRLFTPRLVKTTLPLTDPLRVNFLSRDSYNHLLMYPEAETLENLLKTAELKKGRKTDAILAELREVGSPEAKRYVDFLDNYLGNLQIHIPLTNETNREEEINKLCLPAYYALMMERGLIAAGALFQTMTDANRYEGKTPEKDAALYSRWAGSARMALGNVLRATFASEIYFKNNPKIIDSARVINEQVQIVYDRVSLCCAKLEAKSNK